MAARKDEIAAILKEQIKHFGQDLRMEEVGVVVEVGDGIARVWGLEHAVSSELLEFPGEIYGLVLDLEEDSVGVALMGPDDHIKEGPGPPHGKDPGDPGGGELPGASGGSPGKAPGREGPR